MHIDRKKACPWKAHGHQFHSCSADDRHNQPSRYESLVAPSGCYTGPYTTVGHYYGRQQGGSQIAPFIESPRPRFSKEQCIISVNPRGDHPATLRSYMDGSAPGLMAVPRVERQYFSPLSHVSQPVQGERLISLQGPYASSKISSVTYSNLGDQADRRSTVSPFTANSGHHPNSRSYPSWPSAWNTRPSTSPLAPQSACKPYPRGISNVETLYELTAADNVPHRRAFSGVGGYPGGRGQSLVLRCDRSTDVSTFQACAGNQPVLSEPMRKRASAPLLLASPLESQHSGTLRENAKNSPDYLACSTYHNERLMEESTFTSTPALSSGFGEPAGLLKQTALGVFQFPVSGRGNVMHTSSTDIEKDTDVRATPILEHNSEANRPLGVDDMLTTQPKNSSSFELSGSKHRVSSNRSSRRHRRRNRNCHPMLFDNVSIRSFILNAFVDRVATVGRDQMQISSDFDCSARTLSTDEIGRDWSLSMFQIEKELSKSQHVFIHVGYALLEPLLVSTCVCSNRTLMNFLTALSYSYNKIAYHNDLHAANTAHLMMTLHGMVGTQNYVTNLDTTISILASLGHDAGHFGRSNNFCTESCDILSLLYNDISVLENYHSFLTFSVLFAEQNNVIKSLSRTDFQYVRKLIIELILATDMTHHFSSLTAFRDRVSSSDFSPEKNDSDKWQLIKICLKMADLGHAALNWDDHVEWSFRAAEEFYTQGDKEKELNLPVSQLCDRRRQDQFHRDQTGFLHFVVQPLSKALQLVDRQGIVERTILRRVIHNIEMWKQDGGDEQRKRKKNEQHGKSSTQLPTMRDPVNSNLRFSIHEH